MCRAPLENGGGFSVDEPESESNDEILDFNRSMVTAADNGHIEIVRLMLSHEQQILTALWKQQQGEAIKT